ncbi:MAG: alginate export family protein [Candidatus Omnitrophica bacterium]|nr:alginate export family protein [Candidatus Omnitrophota bacterium]
MQYVLRSFGILVALLLWTVPGVSWALAADSGGAYDSWKFNVGGDERFRTEYRNDFDLKDTVKDNATWFYNRLRLNVKAAYSDEYLNDKLVVFMEGLDARASDNKDFKGANAQKDDFDLHQGYVKAINVADSGVDIKLGRQEFQYGAGRLIAAPTWLNRVRSFDGGVVRYVKNGFSADLLLGYEVLYDTHKFNMAREENFLTGSYFSYQKNNIAPLLEWYYLDYTDIRGTTDTHRQTIGGRVKATIAPETMLDIEVPYQFGNQAGQDKYIHAYAAHADLARTFSSVMWKPKLALAYDQASGDKNATDGTSHTFVPLYQTTHDPYGLLDIVRWQNIRNPELGVTFYPTDKWSFTPQVDWFWLDNRHDAWYSSSGTVTRAATAADINSFLGTEISIRSVYDLTSNIKLEGGYAHLYTGKYLRSTAGGDDPINWVYTQMIVKF